MDAEKKHSDLDVLKRLFRSSHCSDGIFFVEIDSHQYLRPLYKRDFPVFTGHLVYFVVTSGQATLVVDNFEYKCSSQSSNFVELKPFNSLSDIIIDDNFRGYLLVLSLSFLDEVYMGKRPLNFSQILSLRSKSAYDFYGTDMDLIIGCMDHVKRNCALTKHFFAKEVISTSIAEFHLQVMNLILAKNKVEKSPSASDRKEQLCFQFAELLLEYAKTEHNVSFYADKLCITSQYLTKVLKQTININANQMIDSFLIKEAKILLRRRSNSIQQIAELLNYSDQSSFGKFFLKHTGMTPLEYRKSH